MYTKLWEKKTSLPTLELKSTKNYPSEVKRNKFSWQRLRDLFVDMSPEGTEECFERGGK